MKSISMKNVSTLKLKLSVAGALSLAALTVAPQAQAKNGDPLKGEYIVTLKEFDDEHSDQLIDKVMADAGVEKAGIKDRFRGALKGFHGKINAKALDKLKRDPRVELIEQDRELTTEPLGKNQSTSPNGVNDPIPPQPAQSSSWGVARVGYGDGTGKRAFVIDSGIRPDHPDLTVDLNLSASFITGVSSILDGCGHGTAVAGLIAAKDNSIGVVGVAAGATIVALRVFDDYCKGSTSSAIKAVNYAISRGVAGDVINMSLGGGTSSTLDNAVITAAQKGIFVSVAAGNSGVDCINNSPARVNYPNVYTVSSMNQYGQLSSFSNFGQPVDVSGPGEGLLTTNHSGGYGSCTGTSCAAPLLSGLLLIRGKSFGLKGFVTGDKDAWPDPIMSK